MIIIVEGCDRTGKDTLIDNIKSNFLFPPAIEIKSSKLNSIDNFSEDYFKYSVQYYKNLFKVVENISMKDKSQIVILNRSHISEYVYSRLYRNYSGDFVFTAERSFLINMRENNILVVTLLLTDNPKILLIRDDGKSVNKNGKRNIEKEQELFKYAVRTRSLIKNYLILDNSILGEPDKVFEPVKTYLESLL